MEEPSQISPSGSPRQNPSETPIGNDVREAAPPRSRWKRRWLKRLGWAAVWFVTLVVLLVLVENWRGARAWRAYLAELQAADESIQPSSVIPPPIRDEENFAAIPLFQPLFDYTIHPPSPDVPAGRTIWRDQAAKDRLEQLNPLGNDPPSVTGNWRRGEFTDLAKWQEHFRAEKILPSDSPAGVPAQDILRALAAFEPEMSAVRTAASRPRSRFPIHYEEHVNTHLPHYGVLRKFTAVTKLRAVAALALNDSEAAHREVLLGLRITDAISAEPLIIGMLVQVSQIETQMAPLWEGLVRHQWSEAQLAAFEQALAGVDLIASYQRSIRGERALFAGPALDAMRKRPEITRSVLGGVGLGQAFLPQALRFLPSGWLDFNKAHLGHYYGRLLNCADSAGRRIRAKEADELQRDFENEIGAQRLNPHKVIVAFTFPAISPMLERAAYGQATVDLARVAIALERHRLQHGGFPETLDALVPAFLPKVLPDIITGDPLRYRADSNDSFTLYSAGWNARDDGGKLALKGPTKNELDRRNGDWPWPQPAAKTAVQP